MKHFLLACSFVLSACQSVKWGGAYLGVASVTKIDRIPDHRSVGAELNLLIDLGKNCSLQIEPIIPFDTPHKPQLRLAIATRIF